MTLASGIIRPVSELDPEPGGRFDPWTELKFSIRELHAMAGALGAQLGADDRAVMESTWDAQTWRCFDLLERVYRDIGELAGTWLKLKIAEQHGHDPWA